MIRQRWAAILAAVVLTGCGGQVELAQVTPERVASAGNTDRFGAVAVLAMSADGRRVRLRLADRAHVAFYNAHDDGYLELLATYRIAAGEQELDIPLVGGGAMYYGAPRPTGGPIAGSPAAGRRDALVVIVWDRDASPLVLSSIVTPLRVSDGAQPHRLAPLELFERPVAWAAYLVR